MKTTLKQGAFYLTISSLLFILTGYIVNIWLGRFLGPVDYGSYGVIIALISLVNLIQTSGFTQSAAKHIAENENFADAIFKSAFVIQMIATCIITILFFSLAYPLADLLNDLSLVPYIQLAAFIFPIYGFYALLIDYYNGLHAFKKQALLNIIYSLTKTIGIITFAYFLHLKGAIAGFIIAPILAILVGFYYPKSTKSNYPYKKLILFSLPLIGFILFSTLLQSLDLYFVKSLLSGSAAGYYTAGQNIARLPYFATIAISSVILPSISNSVSQKLTEETKKTINNSLRTILLFIIPGILIISATSRELLFLIYSSAYTPAANSLSLLSIAFGFYAVFTLLCTILNAAGHPKQTFILALIGVLLNSLLCIFLIPKLNIVGAAIASILSSVVVVFMAAYFVYNRFHQLVTIISIIRIAIASLIIYFFALVITVPPYLLPLFYILLIVIYIGVLILIREITKEDFLLVNRFLPGWAERRLKL